MRYASGECCTSVKLTLLWQSCEKIRTALDLLEPDRELMAFVEAYGTGSRVMEPPTFSTNDPQKQQLTAAPPSFKVVRYERISRKPEAVYQNAYVGQAPQASQSAAIVYQPPPVVTAPQVIQSSSSTQADNRANGVQGGLQPSRSMNGYEREARQNVPAQTVPKTVQPSTSYPNQSNNIIIPPPPPIPEEPRRPLLRGISIRRQSQPLPAVPRGGNRAARGVEPPVPVPPVPVPVSVPVTDAGNQILFLGTSSSFDQESID